MHVFRLCRARNAALDGEGARLYGGRWNSPGRRVVYASSTLSLAVVETLAHLDPDLVPDDYVALTIEIPDAVAVESVDVTRLSSKWKNYDDTTECRLIGNAWYDGGASAVLRVPAAPVPAENNSLLNVAHADMQRIRVVATMPFQFDPRLAR